MTQWLEYFVAGLHSQMEEIGQKGAQLIKMDTSLQKIKKLGLNERKEKAIRCILKTGKISVNEYQEAASCIRRTAQRDLEDLINKKIIKAVGKTQTDPTKHFVLL